MVRAFEMILIVTCLSALLAYSAEGQRLQFSDNETELVMSVRPGQNVVIECEAVGMPSPVIHWRRNGARIAQTGTGGLDDLGDKYYENLFNSEEAPLLKLSTTKSKLYVDCITESKLGDYSCVAETPDGQITKTFVLQSQAGDLKRQSFHQFGCIKRLSPPTEVSVPARIYMWTDQRLEFEGATVQLFCRADGSPTPTVSWMDRNGRPIVDSDNQKFKVLENGDLLIFNVKWSTDMGQYRCVASNNNGQDAVEIFLYPTIP